MIARGMMQTIEASLVGYLRAGVKHELNARVWDLQDQLETSIDPPTLCCALAAFEDSRSLFELVGFVDEPEQADLLVDLSRWPMLLEVLESQRDREVRRLQDLAVDIRIAPLQDLPALDTLISAIREKTGAPTKARGDQGSESLARPAPARKAEALR